jgi:hypothetical protein
MQGLAANPGGSGKTGLTGSSRVYLGGLTGGTQGPNYGLLHNTPSGDFFKTGDTGAGYATYDTAKTMPLQWDQSTLKQFINAGILNKLPGFKVGMGMPEVMSTWDDLVQSAIAFSAADPNKKWTPWDVMNSYKNDGQFGTIRKGDWEYDAATGEKVKYVGPKTKTVSSKTVDLSSPEDVQAITTQVLTQALGRAPTAKELATYKATINGYEKANPTVSTQTQTLNDMGEIVNTSTVNSGGTTAQGKAALVEEQAKKGPEYGKYQSATTYYNAMMQMITGGG